ncbi:hypothetical protein D3C76_1525240 [compost metagenome]
MILPVESRRYSIRSCLTIWFITTECTPIAPNMSAASPAVKAASWKAEALMLAPASLTISPPLLAMFEAMTPRAAPSR